MALVCKQDVFLLVFTNLLNLAAFWGPEKLCLSRLGYSFSCNHLDVTLSTIFLKVFNLEVFFLLPSGNPYTRRGQHGALPSEKPV